MSDRQRYDFVAWLKEQVPPPEPGDLIALHNHPLLVYERLRKRRESIMPPTDIDIDPTTGRDLAATEDADDRITDAAASSDDPIGGNSPILPGMPLTADPTHAPPLELKPFDPYDHIAAAENAWHHAKALGKSERDQWAAVVCAVVESLGLAS